MAERSSKRKKKETDFAVTAFRVMQQATGDTKPPAEKSLDTTGKNPNAVALGRLGGKKGGPARAAKLTPEQRRDIARKAAVVRWNR